MSKVAALTQVKSHKTVARLEYCHSHGHIGLGTGVRLDIGPARTVEGFQSVDGKLLDFVHYLTSAVIASARVALGVLVGANGAHSAEHFLRNIVF